MSKMKLSFSLISVILLVGILNTAAFASNLYGLKPVQQSDYSLKVQFTGNSADAADILSRQFDLVLKDGNNIVKKYGPVATTGTEAPGSGFFIIPASDLTLGKSYTIELYHTDDTTHATLLSKSSVLFRDAHNVEMYHQPDSHVDVNGSGLKNANQTGINNRRKNRTGQRVHGFYQNNTNSCASCHQTHTGADDNLLFKDGVYSTCSACHDGTTGAYNSFAPVNDKTPNSVAGTFDVLKEGHNGSLHVADGSLKVSAAPGGNHDPSNKLWEKEFNCASCHAAHGAGSKNENNLNLDPMGWGAYQYDPSTKDGQNGKLFQNIKIFTSVPADKTDPYILVRTTTNSDQTQVDTNYFYKREGVKANTPIIQTYRWGYDANTKKDGYVPDYSLWLQEKGYPYKADTALYNDVWGNLSLTAANDYNDTSRDITRSSEVHVVWRDGFAWGAGAANVKSAQVSMGIDVETTANSRSLFDSSYSVLDENGNVEAYIPDSGVEMSKYCAACHIDYLSTTGSESTGFYSNAHRHKTITDNLTCVRCHFGHGTEAQIMKTQNEQTYYDLIKDEGKTSEEAIAYLVDPNPSSSLKRYPGMSGCFACHSQGVDFLGNLNNEEIPVPKQPAPVIPPTYSVKTTAPETLTKSDLLGTAADASFTGMTAVTFQAILINGAPYSGNVRIQAPDVDGIELWAKDSKGNWYDINKTGWGPSTGFILDLTVLSLYPIISNVVTEASITIPFKVVDVKTGDVVVSGSNTINLN